MPQRGQQVGFLRHEISIGGAGEAPCQGCSIGRERLPKREIDGPFERCSYQQTFVFELLLQCRNGKYRQLPQTPLKCLPIALYFCVVFGPTSAARVRMWTICSTVSAVGYFAKPSIFMSTFWPDRFKDWMMRTITKSFVRRQRRKSAAQTA